jgi:hypothetical protein
MCDKLPYENPRIDHCLQLVLGDIKNLGFKPVASCCGHGKYPMTVVVRCPDGTFMEYFSKTTIPRKKRNRYYTRDSDGYYYIKECFGVEP